MENHFNVRPLQDGVNFGVCVTGLTHSDLSLIAVRGELNRLFERHGMILFEDVDPTDAMQLEISRVFGPLKEHPISVVSRAELDDVPGVIRIENDPAHPEDAHIFRVDGQDLTQWQPWHFDHSYTDKINRAGVLRAITIAPDGGKTGFVDGIELYNSISPDLQERLLDVNIVYFLDPLYQQYRVGMPSDFRVVRLERNMRENADYVRNLFPRAIHPAVLTRHDGQKVLHLSFFPAAGIEGQEHEEGKAFFSQACAEIFGAAKPYFHSWKPRQMIVWDNWRMLHSATGVAPGHARKMHRTTIEGDYGLGRFERQRVEA